MRAKKPLIVTIGLLAIIAIAAAVVMLAPNWLFPQSFEFQHTKKGLPQDQVFRGQASATRSGVRLGEPFTYLVEVWYDPAEIASVDRASLDKNLDFKPFEVRNLRDSEYTINARTRAFRREYELQLLNGKVNQSYEFPSFVVRYKFAKTDAYADKAIVPAPVFVAAMVPDNLDEVELKPITTELVDPGNGVLPPILWGVAALLGVVALGDLGWRVLPRWRALVRRRSLAQSPDKVARAYRALVKNLRRGADREDVLYQIDHVVRMVLVRQQQGSWLQEPNLDALPENLRPSATQLLDGNSAGSAEDAVAHLDKILKAYYGDRQVEAWKN